MHTHTVRSTTRAAALLFGGLALIACDPKIMLGEFDTQGKDTDSAGGDSSTGAPQDSSTGGGTADSSTSDAPDPGTSGTEGESTGGTSGTEGESSGGTADSSTSDAPDLGTSGTEGQGSSSTGAESSTGEPDAAECDPLLQDCWDGETCIPDPDDDQRFICTVDGSGAGGHAFDPCEEGNACDPGLLCVEPSAASECDQMAPGCCVPFCELGVPDFCFGAGQVCVPWFEEGQAPPGLEHVGICGLEP